MFWFFAILPEISGENNPHLQAGEQMYQNSDRLRFGQWLRNIQYLVE